MTILQLKNNNFKLNIAIFALSLIFGIIILNLIFTYNQVVSLSHDIKVYKNKVAEASVLNSEMKNKLYDVLDFKNAGNVIASENLIIDNNPKYLEATSKWLSVLR